jgi:alkylation response protein AidB-like acyl-CoA dehydrogenase
MTTTQSPREQGVERARASDHPAAGSPFVTPEKQANYDTERYLGAVGLNWYTSDPQLRFLMRYYLSNEDLEWAEPHLTEFGALAGGPIAERAELTDKNPPRLQKYDRWGHDISEVVLPESALATKRDLGRRGVHALAKTEEARRRGGVPPLVGAAYAYMLNQAEIGMYCATGMTAGVADLVARYAPPDVRDWVMPKFDWTEYGGPDAWDGAMLLTERTGGSDLSTLETTATPEGDHYLLNGFKWFASNGDGKAIVTLAKPEGAPDGMRGIGLFLVPKYRRDGSRNGIRIRQLKDKLGTKAVPSAELEFVDAEAYLLSGEGGSADGRGVSRMMDMVTGSRIGVASMGAGCARRALVESICYARARSAFGDRLIDKPLMRHKLTEMIVDMEAALALLFESYGVLNHHRQTRDTRSQRLAVPLAKLRASRLGITMAGDAVDIHGGNGYVETWPVARILRDAHVNTLWEGTDHVLYLDVRRAMEREQAEGPLLDRMREAAGGALETVAAAKTVASAIEDLDAAIEGWKRLDRATGEARLGVLSGFMIDVLAGAFLVEQADWEQRELGDDRKALVAKLYAQRYLESRPLRGIDADDREAEARFDELLAGALVDERPR